MNKFAVSAILTLFWAISTYAQSEVLTNAEIIEMSRSGLSTAVLLKKISMSKASFDLSAKALVDMRSAGVNDDVIALMLDRETSSQAIGAQETDSKKLREPASGPTETSPKTYPRPVSITFQKSSLQPSRQALEKELLKRTDFSSLGLTILRYKEQADLYVEIGFVSGSIITHRYVYRIYDRRSGAVIAAGETTSWGSLAENLARHIAKSLSKVIPKYSST